MEIGIFEWLIHEDDELPDDGSQSEFGGSARRDSHIDGGPRSWYDPLMLKISTASAIVNSVR